MPAPYSEKGNQAGLVTVTRNGVHSFLGVTARRSREGKAHAPGLTASESDELADINSNCNRAF